MKSLSNALLESAVPRAFAHGRDIRSAALFCAVTVSACSLPAYAATFTEFDPPGSIGTYPMAISDGAIAGDYQDKYGDIHGFLRAADNSITSFDVGPSETIATSINERGTITGWYTISSAVAHGFAPYDVCTSSGAECSFVRTADGTTTVFTPDGSVGSQAMCINASGWIAGISYSSDSHGHGFVRTADGTITTFDPAGSTVTNALSINRSGVIAGYYHDSNSNYVYHGFVRAADGTITTFDPTGSTSSYARSINENGVITGSYIDSNNVYHGFTRTSGGTITTFDPSGSTGTDPWGIANSGTVAGFYYDNSGVSHGFIRRPTGKIKSFDPPGSTQTYPMSIDSARTDRNAITGYYQDSSGIYHGFLRTP